MHLSNPISVDPKHRQTHCGRESTTSPIIFCHILKLWVFAPYSYVPPQETEYIVAKNRQRRKLIRQPRNLVEEDGLMWIKRAGRLWGTYKTCAEYMGLNPGSFATFVWRHNLNSIKHGRRSLVSKEELNRKSGALSQEAKWRVRETRAIARKCTGSKASKSVINSRKNPIRQIRLANKARLVQRVIMPATVLWVRLRCNRAVRILSEPDSTPVRAFFVVPHPEH